MSQVTHKTQKLFSISHLKEKTMADVLISPIHFNVTMSCVNLMKAINNVKSPRWWELGRWRLKCVNGWGFLTWECCSRAWAFSFCSRLSSASSFWQRFFKRLWELSRACFSASRFIISCCTRAVSSLAAARSTSASRLRSTSSAFSLSVWKGNKIFSLWFVRLCLTSMLQGNCMPTDL